MDNNKPFNLTIFTDSTKKSCICTSIAIFLIIIFIISPLNKFIYISFVIRIITIILIIYIIYLNIYQLNSLRIASNNNNSEEIKSQLNMNLFCTYVFILFIFLLFIFTIKSFF